jgi:tetratricopeptide (TPR) repeat protein
MKIIRWLISHFFLILLIVSVIYGYMYWGNLAGKDTPGGEAIAYLSNEFVEFEDFVNAVKAKQSQLSGHMSSENQSIENNQRTSEAEAVLNSAESDGNTNLMQAGSIQNNNTVALNNSVQQTPATITYSHNQMRVQQNSAANVGQEAEKTEAEKIHENTMSADRVKQNNNVQSIISSAQSSSPKSAFVSSKIEKQLNNVDQHGRVINRSLQSDAVRAAWITARKSFYQRNYALSEKSYQKVIENTEDNFDAYGELGNVYFNQGKQKQAASAYFEAAAIMLRKGQIRRAQNLMPLLWHLDKTRANELKQLIDSVLS